MSVKDFLAKLNSKKTKTSNTDSQKENISDSDEPSNKQELRNTSQGSFPSQDVTISASPKFVRIFEGDRNPVEIKILIIGRDSSPNLKVTKDKSSSNLHMKIHEILEKSEAKPYRKKEGEVVYTLPLCIDLTSDPTLRRALIESCKNQKYLQVQGKIQCEDSNSVTVYFHIYPFFYDYYPGQVAIDLGTSSSSVTVCDPKHLVPRPLPSDQEECLRKKFYDWFSQPASQALPGANESEWLTFLQTITKGMGVGCRKVASSPY